MIRKGQVRWLAKGDVVGQVHFIEQAFAVAASLTSDPSGTESSPCRYLRQIRSGLPREVCRSSRNPV